MSRKTKRCRYGKLRRPIGRRRCKLKPKGRTHRTRRSRRSSRGQVRTPFLVAGLATAALAAVYWSRP